MHYDLANSMYKFHRVRIKATRQGGTVFMSVIVYSRPEPRFQVSTLFASPPGIFVHLVQHVFGY